MYILFESYLNHLYYNRKDLTTRQHDSRL